MARQPRQGQHWASTAPERGWQAFLLRVRLVCAHSGDQVAHLDLFSPGGRSAPRGGAQDEHDAHLVRVGGGQQAQRREPRRYRAGAAPEQEWSRRLLRRARTARGGQVDRDRPLHVLSLGRGVHVARGRAARQPHPHVAHDELAQDRAHRAARRRPPLQLDARDLEIAILIQQGRPGRQAHGGNAPNPAAQRCAPAADHRPLLRGHPFARLVRRRGRAPRREQDRSDPQAFQDGPRLGRAGRGRQHHLRSALGRGVDPLPARPVGDGARRQRRAQDF